jgi:hypothetical protein
LPTLVNWEFLYKYIKVISNSIVLVFKVDYYTTSYVFLVRLLKSANIMNFWALCFSNCYYIKTHKKWVIKTMDSVSSWLIFPPLWLMFVIHLCNRQYRKLMFLPVMGLICTMGTKSIVATFFKLPR